MERTKKDDIAGQLARVYPLRVPHIQDGVPKMMKADYRIWNIFHDGDIAEVKGETPGDITIRVEIPYLRQMILPSGTSFIVTLHDCTRFEYEGFGGPRIAGSQDVAKVRPEVLIAELDGDAIRITCTDGTLITAYGYASVALESGETTAFDDLTYACERYWTEWKAGRLNHTQVPIVAKRASQGHRSAP